jgi:hypothetical protein
MPIAPIQFAGLPEAYSNFDFAPLAKLAESMKPRDKSLAAVGDRLGGEAAAPGAAAGPPTSGAVPYVTPSGAPSANAGSASTGGNVQSWYDFARRPAEQGGLGLSHEQAVGKIANLQAESGKDIPSWGPTGDKGSAWGAAQWRNERLANLQQFAAARGLDYKSTEAQQAFMRHEYLGAGGYGGGSERGAYDRLLTTRSPQEAATAINRYYERSADRRGVRENTAASLANILRLTGDQ